MIDDKLASMKPRVTPFEQRERRITMLTICTIALLLVGSVVGSFHYGAALDACYSSVD